MPAYQARPSNAATFVSTQTELLRPSDRRAHAKKRMAATTRFLASSFVEAERM